MPLNQSQNNMHGNVCSRAHVASLINQMHGHRAELEGHEHNGHIRAHLGRSFGRPEGEIIEDMERVQQAMINCNQAYH